ncbi:uncharacterized protein [Atheta coriaria]|uniref:uncharacterized protein isoform X1 n=1 Tax=Dalotia coriaria TaxID=877792 RepID=UPI0031F3BB01
MKYPQLVSMPSAVSDWLEEQLEARGIDAVVYTRYVLSLLYRDPVDIICPDQDLHITHPNKEVRRAGGGRKRLCRSSDYSHWGHADADRLKRSAAVECLKSASDQKCGIESLVDELCAKLKEIQREGEVVSVEEPRIAKETKAVRIPKKLSERDSARRYYAAFPALARTPSNPSPKLVHFIPKWLGSPKRRIAGKKSQRGAASLEEKLHCKQEAEMKARSTGKHRFNYFSRGVPGGHKEQTRREAEPLQHSAVMNEEAMYEDLPVLGDIRDLLDSPSPPSTMMPVDLMNLANMTDTGSNKFLQCGTNIISSIWSTSKDSLQPVDLDHEFSNIRIDHGVWASPPQSFFDDESGGDEWSYTMQRWSDGYEQESLVAKSLLKLNHNRDDSCFAEVRPRSRFTVRANQAPVLSPRPVEDVEADALVPKDDLLHSDSSHFKPINEKAEAKNRVYANGTTFAIHANLDVVAFQRSESGTLFLQESGCNKRYQEYKKDLSNNNLRLKFIVNPNDKGCQTDAADLDVSLSRLAFTLTDCDVYSDDIDAYFDEQLSDAESSEQRPDSMMAELFGKEHKCEQCCGDSPWSQRQQLAGSAASSNIWNGEICMSCLRASHSSDGGAFKVTPLEERQQLREDIQEDGEQLLSDLSSLQKSYMEEDLPFAENTCDIGALICSTNDDDDDDDHGNVHGNTAAWRQLRIKHNSGGVPIHSASFSFATRLQQDCLLKMATIPTLRSVTL